MEHPSTSIAHPSILYLPRTLIEILLGRSLQSWGASLHKSASRLWSSVQYRADIHVCLQDPVLRREKEDGEICLWEGDAEIVLGRLGLSGVRGRLIGPEEMLRLFEEKEPSLEEVREAFRVFDFGGDGFIDAEELQRVLRRLGFEEGKEVEECERMIGAFDENGDGKIDFREFVKLMESCFC